MGPSRWDFNEFPLLSLVSIDILAYLEGPRASYNRVTNELQMSYKSGAQKV